MVACVNKSYQILMFFVCLHVFFLMGILTLFSLGDKMTVMGHFEKKRLNDTN